jgi:peptide-methionine (S)-S-oxide reductase
MAMRNVLAAVLMIFASCAGCNAASHEPIPAPVSDSPLAQSPAKETAVFAGGCFWGTQSVFERVKGVISTTAGDAGNYRARGIGQSGV